MELKQIQRLLAVRPFKSFEIHLAGGRAVLVDHPENIWLRDGTIFVWDTKDRAADIFELGAISSLRHPVRRR